MLNPNLYCNLNHSRVKTHTADHMMYISSMSVIISLDCVFHSRPWAFHHINKMIIAMVRGIRLFIWRPTIQLLEVHSHYGISPPEDGLEPITNSIISRTSPVLKKASWECGFTSKWKISLSYNILAILKIEAHFPFGGFVLCIFIILVPRDDCPATLYMRLYHLAHDIHPLHRWLPKCS